MGDTTYTLGDGKAIVKFDKSGTAWVEFSDRLNKDVKPHELMKIAKAIEDNNRLRELGEDSNHIA